MNRSLISVCMVSMVAAVPLQAKGPAHDEKEIRSNCQYITTGASVEAVIQTNGYRQIFLENASTKNDAEQIIADKVRSGEYLSMVEGGNDLTYVILPYRVYVVALMDEKNSGGIVREKRSRGFSVWLKGPTHCGKVVLEKWELSKK